MKWVITRISFGSDVRTELHKVQVEQVTTKKNLSLESYKVLVSDL